MNRIDIAVEGLPPPPWLDDIDHFAQRALAALGKDGWVLSVLVCGAERIRELNAEYRGKDEPTDVLSFEQGARIPGEDGEELYIAGDIVISVDGLARNVEEFSVPEAEELRRLVLHGILHLDGLDHGSNDPSEPMLAAQERLLAELGIGAGRPPEAGPGGGPPEDGRP